MGVWSCGAPRIAHASGGATAARYKHRFFSHGAQRQLEAFLKGKDRRDARFRKVLAPLPSKRRVEGLAAQEDFCLVHCGRSTAHARRCVAASASGRAALTGRRNDERRVDVRLEHVGIEALALLLIRGRVRGGEHPQRTVEVGI
eukprot:4750510-Prymnesium_polylepis.1